jgi:phage/plasmid-associated DNA primase
LNCPWLATQRGDLKLDRIVGHLRGILEHKAAFDRKDQRTVHLANGVYCFDNGGAVMPFTPSLISRNVSPIGYDSASACPRFLNELLLPAVHEEDVGLIQKYGGMSLLGKNVIQRMLILDGYTARGKTQLANVIQEIVGRENVAQLRTRLLDQRFELYRFVKKTLLVGVDVDAEFLSTSAAYVLKGLVGGDYFNAEQKFGTGDFYFEGDFCVLITSNQPVARQAD